MKILVACEYSGVVRDAFIRKGHKAISCDILPSESQLGEHYQGDVTHILDMDWDMVIAFPPCTDLTVACVSQWPRKKADGRQGAAIDFFMRFANCQAKKVCIENPLGIMSTVYKKPTQIIHPYYFGDSYQKRTCLWLKGLPPLFHAKQIDLFTNTITHVHRGEIKTFVGGKRMPAWFSDAKSLGAAGAAKRRSLTFPGIAKAMAEQWG